MLPSQVFLLLTNVLLLAVSPVTASQRKRQTVKEQNSGPATFESLLGSFTPRTPSSTAPSTASLLLGSFSPPITPSPARTSSLRQPTQLLRQPKQLQQVPGGVDFSTATRTGDGRLCVVKEDEIETMNKDPVLDCIHKQVEKCHLTYITYFEPAQEEQCHENFEKTCQITFAKEAASDLVMKCMTPLIKVCNGQGPDECQTKFESSCTTRYVEKTPGKFEAQTDCEKLPTEICGQGCITEEGPEECHDKTVHSLIDVPEEVCDINPQETCSLVTRLVPSLKPTKECTIVPQEICSLKFTNPRMEKKPLRTEWCLDENSVTMDSDASDPGTEASDGYIGGGVSAGSGYGSPRSDRAAVTVEEIRTALERLRRFRKALM